jgi:hypothetical protein
MTVAAHEFGHALGMDHSSYSTAVMYATYNGIKQALTSDDTAGIQSIYGVRPHDQFNSNGQRNNCFFTATDITSYIDGNAQIAIPGLDNTTVGDSEWYTVTVPSTTTGTMTVREQSKNLSSLSPDLLVYNSSLSLIGQASAPFSMGATVSVTISNVQPGQTYYYKVMAPSWSLGPVGGYGLLVNFGSQSQPLIPPPNTVVAQQPDQGDGTINATGNLAGGNGSQHFAPSDSQSFSLNGLPGSLEFFAMTSSTLPGTVITASTSSNLAGPLASEGGGIASGPDSLVLLALDTALAQWPTSRHAHR